MADTTASNPYGSYVDKSGKTMNLPGTLEQQNLAANKAGYDWVPNKNQTKDSPAQGPGPASTMNVNDPTYGSNPAVTTDSSAVRRDITAAGGSTAVPPDTMKSQTYEDFSAKIGATTAPAPAAPNTVDQYAKLRQDQGISAIEDSIGQYEGEKADLMAAAAKFKRGDTAGYSEATAGARISEEERNIQDRLDFIGRQEALAQGKLTIKNNYIQSIMSYTKDDYATARQNYEYEFNKNIQMQNAYSTAMNREMTLDEKQKNDARATITSMWNMGKDTIGRDPQALDKFIADYGNDLNQLEMIAGEPVGSTEAFLRAKPGATIVAKGDGVSPTGNIASWTQSIGPDGTPMMTWADTGVKPRPTAASTKASTAQEISDHFDSIARSDGYVDPKEFINARANSPLSPTEFDNRFGKYVNPESYGAAKLAPLGATTKKGGIAAGVAAKFGITATSTAQ